MHPTASSAVLPIQWRTRGDARRADEMAVVVLRHLRQIRSPNGPLVLLVLAVVTTLVLVLAMGVVGFGIAVSGIAAGGLVAVYQQRIVPRRLAEQWRRQPAFSEPGTLTLDAEGLHVVTASVALHERWQNYRAAAVDEDFLLLVRRGVDMVQGYPLEDLDPSVDRSAVLAEIRRLIAAGAPAGQG